MIYNLGICSVGTLKSKMSFPVYHTKVTWVNEWLLFNANSAIFQLYHGENKLIFNKMRYALYFACFHATIFNVENCQPRISQGNLPICCLFISVLLLKREIPSSFWCSTDWGERRLFALLLLDGFLTITISENCKNVTYLYSLVQICTIGYKTNL